MIFLAFDRESRQDGVAVISSFELQVAPKRRLHPSQPCQFLYLIRPATLNTAEVLRKTQVTIRQNPSRISAYPSNQGLVDQFPGAQVGGEFGAVIALAPDFFEEGAAFTGDDIYVALHEFAF